MNTDIRRILFPTDFSDAARHAQIFAMELAQRFNAELHVLHAIAPIPASTLEPGLSLTPLDVSQLYDTDAAKRSLTKLIGEQWTKDHRTVQAVEIGFAVDEIIRYSRTNQIDLIVMGTHGHTGLSRWILGSVAEKVVRLAECPVLTVHPRDHQFQDKSSIESAGVG